MMIAVDVFLCLLSSAFMLWAINYSILAQTVEDRREAVGNFMISYMFILLTIASVVFVLGYDGGI